MSRSLVYYCDYASDRPIEESLLGGKAVSLLRLARQAFPVPQFYVITVEALVEALVASGHSQLLDHDWMSRMQGGTKSDLRALAERSQAKLLALELPELLVAQVAEVHRRTFPPEADTSQRFAVRSSAVGEDGAETSFAGIHDSLLDVPSLYEVLRALPNIWASAYSYRALSYRLDRRLERNPIRLAVIVQQMVPARFSGVLQTRHPDVEKRGCLLLNLISGLGNELLSGRVDGSSYTVDRETLEVVAGRIVADCDAPSSDGLQPAMSTEASLIADCVDESAMLSRIRQAARFGLSIEASSGSPQEVEFCFDENERLFILQAREAILGQQAASQSAYRLVWDNANIVESYSGIVSPMTFSFVRQVYCIVYQCFAEVMGVSPSVIQQHRRTYDSMLGLIRGRIYYNLKSWYRALRLLPAFETNRLFLESMMGVEETLRLDEEAQRPGLFRRWLFAYPALGAIALRSTWNLIRLDHSAKQFYRNFDRHYQQWSTLDFGAKTPQELQSLYYEMEEALLRNWKAPIINDFFLMIFYGLLNRLCATWCEDETQALHNELLQGDGNIESARPTKLLLQLAKLAQETPRLRDLILTEELESIPQLVAEDGEFQGFGRQMNDYLEQYGFRCADELKLEQPSFRERPYLVYQVLRQYLALDNADFLDAEKVQQRERRIRSQAERKVKQRLAATRSLLPRCLIFAWVLRNARKGVRNRENMRFRRTQVFGLLREMICALGKWFARRRILDCEEDIFYLTLDEVWDYLKGSAVTTDLRRLAHLRRREYDRYRDDLPEPDDRFETLGAVYDDNSFRHPAGDDNVASEQQLHGIGCCAGVACGPIRVVEDPVTEQSLRGMIVVARRMDPGWVPLFPLVAGVLVERGSLLSHVAVVAREMGVPTIVGVKGLLSQLSNGMVVQMDGRTGTVEVLAKPSSNSDCNSSGCHKTSSTRNRP